MGAAVLAVVAIAMVVLAVTLPVHAAARTPPVPVAQAQDTVLGFLTAAVLNDDAAPQVPWRIGSGATALV